jgi:hypothetical protein
MARRALALLCASLLVGVVGPASAQPGPALVFAAEVPVAVQLTLWPLDFQRGRAQPLLHNFMAQLQFSGETAAVTCALRMPDANGELQPGATMDLAIRCGLPFRVLPGGPDFRVSAGGRAIGAGRLRAAALAQVMAAGAAASSGRGAQDQ